MGRGVGVLAGRVSAALRRRRRRTARVEVLYQPDDDGSPDPGEVVWAWIPYEEDPRQGKDRPVVVIGVAGRLLAAVTLTSKPHPERRDQVSVGSGSWDQGRRVSYARLDRILGLRPDQVRREGATLDRRRFDVLIEHLEDRPGWPEIALEVVAHS